MIFNSLTFLVFFALVYTAYRIIPGWAARKGMLLIASYIFYGAWNPPFALLLFLSTVIDWYVAGRMGNAATIRGRRGWLLCSLIVNFGLLGFFKYGNFLLNNTVTILGAMGITYQPPHLDIILPVGISFYTFQTLSYTIDVYRGSLRPVRSLADFALYVSFFPQLVAGPIVRASDFLHQLTAPPQPQQGLFVWGLFLMTLGLFQKVVLADVLLASSAETIFSHPFPLALLDAWAGVLAFTFQILFDFAGYSTCAIGAALCFGFSLNNNFRFPYASAGFSDFWRRWHISLSTWLRDYLYIPLGGNRKGPTRTIINLMLVMTLGGLWHGAAWTFVAWGALHGAFLIMERLIRPHIIERSWAQHPLAHLSLTLSTFIAICVTWVFFRSSDFSSALRLLSAMCGASASNGDLLLSTKELIQVFGVTATVLTLHHVLRNTTIEALVLRIPRWLLVAAWTTMTLALLLAQGNGNAFIYFQF